MPAADTITGVIKYGNGNKPHDTIMDVSDDGLVGVVLIMHAHC